MIDSALTSIREIHISMRKREREICKYDISEI